MIENLRKDLRKYSRPDKVPTLQNFFKTEKGQYGEGDVFLGITVPDSRKIAIKYHDISMNSVLKLLNSKIHEERLVSLLILVQKYNEGTESEKKKIVKFYIDNAKKVNSWDLVDLSSHYILGDSLKNSKDRKVLYNLARSKNLWEKRISIIATFAFIKNNDLDDTLRISEILLKDDHDLIHKAVGWMLREVGKKNLVKEETFLKKTYKKMPRTMLRYAIEKFPEPKRKHYLKK